MSIDGFICGALDERWWPFDVWCLGMLVCSHLVGDGVLVMGIQTCIYKGHPKNPSGRLTIKMICRI